MGYGKEKTLLVQGRVWGTSTGSGIGVGLPAEIDLEHGSPPGGSRAPLETFSYLRCPRYTPDQLLQMQTSVFAASQMIPVCSPG